MQGLKTMTKPVAMLSASSVLQKAAQAVEQKKHQLESRKELLERSVTALEQLQLEARAQLTQALELGGKYSGERSVLTAATDRVSVKLHFLRDELSHLSGDEKQTIRSLQQLRSACNAAAGAGPETYCTQADTVRAKLELTKQLVLQRAQAADATEGRTSQLTHSNDSYQVAIQELQDKIGAQRCMLMSHLSRAGAGDTALSALREEMKELQAAAQAWIRGTQAHQSIQLSMKQKILDYRKQLDELTTLQKDNRVRHATASSTLAMQSASAEGLIKENAKVATVLQKRRGSADADCEQLNSTFQHRSRAGDILNNLHDGVLMLDNARHILLLWFDQLQVQLLNEREGFNSLLKREKFLEDEAGRTTLSIHQRCSDRAQQDLCAFIMLGLNDGVHQMATSFNELASQQATIWTAVTSDTGLASKASSGALSIAFEALPALAGEQPSVTWHQELMPDSCFSSTPVSIIHLKHTCNQPIILEQLSHLKQLLQEQVTGIRQHVATLKSAAADNVDRFTLSVCQTKGRMERASHMIQDLLSMKDELQQAQAQSDAEASKLLRLYTTKRSKLESMHEKEHRRLSLELEELDVQGEDMRLQTKQARSAAARWSLTPDQPAKPARVSELSWPDDVSVDSGFALALLPGQQQNFRAHHVTGTRKFMPESTISMRPAKIQRTEYDIPERVDTLTKQRTFTNAYAVPGDFDDFPRTSAAGEYATRSAWGSVTSVWAKSAAVSRPSEWEVLPREKRGLTAGKPHIVPARKAATSPAASFSMFREDLF